MSGMNKNTKILTAGFVAILAGMAGLVALFIFHISTISTEDRLNADLMEKNFAAYKMRDAAEKRLFSLFRIIAIDDYFERDELRQKMLEYAGDFIAARARISVDRLNDGEHRALENILEAVRASQPVIEGAVDLAVEDQWSPEVQAKVIASTQQYSKLHNALNVFVAEVEAATAQRHGEIATLREREMKVIPSLGVILFFVSLGVGMFVIRREMSHTKTLERRVQERTNMLTERETHFRTIVETAADGIISTDAKGNIESFNPASERLFGYSASEVIGRSINTLMPMHDAAHHGKSVV